ncbi:hypothetical protein FJT64_017406 [Amphibalanus amphitrite]|uniref:Secreted protein n=1 Tax=Amphibalanus amphitrite TaxID=1232801 RepID=A0A6A4WY30_AMPAM|nr:hypothetical protein FJT64_017406 [Amphibalanus amphitrite]
MGVPVHPVCLLAAALLLVTAPAAPNCAALVADDSQLPTKCQGQPILALFYNCYASSSEPIWLANAEKILDDCQSNVQQGLTLRQTAVYAYTCLKWSSFALCDSQQAEDGDLDGEGQQRRAEFFYSDCPLSPQSLQGLLEVVTGRTFVDCGLDSPNGYAATIDNMRCLLQNFQHGVNLDYDALKSALNSALTGANAQQAQILLDEVVTKCENSPKTEDFVKCWASVGVLSCVYKDANELAEAHPKQCELTA